jgi:tetratricopeptide (TPR) repeat protein
MPRKNAISNLGTSLASPRLVRAVRDLLRQLGRPCRLRRDSITSRYLPSLDSEVNRNVLTSSSEGFIRSVIAELPSRCRIVIERIEFDGQSVANVAKALALSERQVYRDRALALNLIARRLSAYPQDAPRAVEVSQPVDARLSYARMLEQVGQLGLASTVLSDIAEASDDPRDRASTYCALARLALEQGSSSAARSYAERAISSAMNANGDTLARCEADAVLGAIALRHGRAEAASEILRRSCTGLRSVVHGTQQARSTEALARALLSLSRSYDARGAFQKARDAADEAVVRLGEMARPITTLQLEARAQMATILHFLGESSQCAEAELRTCYDGAVGSGFILIAMDIAVTLATFYRLRGAGDLAVKLLAPLASVCKNVTISRTKACYFGSFATILSSSGNIGLAEVMLSQAVESTLPAQPDIEAKLHLVATRTKLIAGSPLEAIDESVKAQLLLLELGRTGLLGVSLHLRSLALIALGRYGEALQTVQDAVDALSAGHPQARALAQGTLASLRAAGTRHLPTRGANVASITAKALCGNNSGRVDGKR